jgi:hypothetical protein
MTRYLLLVLTAGVFALAGCGKSDKGGAQSIPANLDFAKFQQAFPSPTPGQLSNIAAASDAIRHRLYPEALATLQKLAGDSDLTEPQKKAVDDLIQGVTQAMANAPTPPAP